MVVVFWHLGHLHHNSSWVLAKKGIVVPRSVVPRSVVPCNVFSWQALDVDHCCFCCKHKAVLTAMLIAVMTAGAMTLVTTLGTIVLMTVMMTLMTAVVT